MPYIPHTEQDIAQMLSTLEIDSIDCLFDEIPEELTCQTAVSLPAALNEQDVRRLATQRLADSPRLNFIGAGAYEHHIPAPVWQIASRGEFYSAYTPYQAEASQGTLQVLYEYQTMMARLTAMDASNASLYDGASALAEAVLMAVRSHRKSKSRKILVPACVNPAYRDTVRTIVSSQKIELIEIPFDPQSGHIDQTALDQHAGSDITALIIPCPNFFGGIDKIDDLTDWAKENNALSIAVVNPMALGLLKPPGEWGEEGVDIACGEGQPLGIPLSFGGPYFGFMCCKKKHVRQMPGRIIGRTIDINGDPGYVLTLQAREQHIRRSKATSNICTNQGLMVTAATIYLTLLGSEGLYKTALKCHQNTLSLKRKLASIKGVRTVFNSPEFHEFVIELPVSADSVVNNLAKRAILAGYPLNKDFPDRDNQLLVCVTESKTEEDMELFAQQLSEAISEGDGKC